MTSRANPIGLYRNIREGYLRYFDTAFWIRDQGMLDERRALLEQDGVIFQQPLLEVMPSYPSVASIAEVCAGLGYQWLV